ncbi:MAG: hypothetical protein ACR2LJ_11580 [Acidimicrobiales bacterium]
MIRLDAATVLLQWAAGGLFFLWITTRRRELGIGYGWLMRSVFGVLAVGAFWAGRLVRPDTVRDTCSLATAAAAGVALGVSIVRRRAGVAGERARRRRKEARVAAMMGDGADSVPGAPPPPLSPAREPAEFPPVLDLVAPVIGIVGLVAAALAAGGPTALALARTLVGAAFLGSITDAMLLGHWYLVQPGLGRAPILELIRWLAGLWPLEIAVLIWPTGMLSVLSGSVDDGWKGTLGWFWVACALATIILVWVTSLALEEKAYSAVMAATGLLYLAILTAFGTDLVARAVLTR